MADTDWSKFSPASPPSGETDWSNFTPDEVKQKDQDSALVRGTKNAWNSIKTGGALLTGDADLAAQLAAERDAYRRANPGTKEGNELMNAWESGDGISGGISNVAGEMAKDWREAPGVMAGIRETGKNLSAMGGGIVEQIPNMVAPMGGMLAGGAAGSMAGPAGAIGGAWAGATAGNTLVESGEQVDRALMTAGINPQDKEAVRDFLAKNGDTILGQAGTKGAIIGAVDTATLGLGSKLLRAPTKAAIERAIASGINPTDNLAIQAAVKADPIYLATQKGASALGRNAVVAGLEPAGEFTGEYLGQGVATGDWDTKGAALEALSSLGQSGITFAGQKIYDAATSPLRKSAPGEQASTVTTPEDTAQMNAANADLGGAQFNYKNTIPSDQKMLPPGVITVPNNAGGETVVDANNGPISSAAVTAVTNSTLAEDVASGMPLKGYSPEQANEELASRPDADRYEIKPHPVSGDRGRVAIVPKSAQALAEIDAKAAAGNEAMARNEQLSVEEDARKQSAQTAKDVQSMQKQVIDMHRSAAAIEKSITPNTSPQDVAIAREQAADLRSQAKTLNEQIKEIANAPQMATTGGQGSGGIAGGSTGNTQAVGGVDGGRGGSAGSSVSGRGADISMGDASVSDAALDELSPAPVQPMSEMPAMQAIAQQRTQQATQQADVRAQQLAQEEGTVAEQALPTVKVPRPMKVGGLRAAKYSDEQLQAVVDNANVPATSRRAAAAEIAWRQAESEAAAQTEIAQSTGKMSLPRDDSWLADLFSQSTTPEAAAVDAENNAKSAQAKIERSDAAIAMLTGEIHANTAEAAELAARKYKQNRKQVELKGDGPLRNPSMSVSQINENRRRRAIEAKSKSSSAMAKAIDSIASDADGFFGQVADMVDRVTQQFNEGFFGPNAVLDDQLDMAVGSLVGASQASGEKSAGRQIRMAAVAYKEGEAPAGKLSRQRAGESPADYQYRMAAEKNQAKAQRQQQPETATEAEDIAAVRRAIKDPKAEVSVVAEESMPDMDKAAHRQVSKQSATFLRHVAKTFGKEIVFVDGMESDGFYRSGNKIYLSTKSSVHHVRVLGHEMLHAMKRQNRASYDKLLKAVSEIATDAQLTGQFKDYFAMDAKMNQKTDAEIAEWIADPANREMILEEMMADLSGNRWAESSFWESVFTKIDAKYGSEQAKGIIAKLRLALVNALNKLMSLVKGGQFKVDTRVAEHLESIREALATGFADYAKAVKDKQVSEDGVGEVKFSGKQTNIDKLKKLMTDREKSKVGKRNADRIVELFNVMPSEKEMAAVAYAGKAKRGWYKNSANALTHLFGSEARRFAGLLAALSPQVSVEVNTRNALRMWANWDSAGRPTDKPSIMRLLGQSVEGSGTEASVMGAWVNNSMEALTTKNLDDLTLSGPKVNSFMLNLVGNWEEVTNDAWVANYALVDQNLFSGTGKSKDGSDPGKGAGYLAMNVKTRMAAKILSKETGVTWTPAEVQETIWSWAKTMLETLDASGETRTAKQLMNDGVITDDLIAATPDFELLFRQEPYAGILRNAGLEQKLNTMPMPKHEDPGRAPFADEKRQGMLDEAARRIEFLQRQRRTNMQISWEAKPGGTTGILPGIFGAPLHVQQQYLADVFAEFDMLQVGKKLGIDFRRTLFGPSAWKGDVAAGAQTILQKIGIVADNMGSVKVDADSRKNLEVAASILGYVLNQEGVYWHYPIYRAPDNHAMYPTGVEVNFGRSLTTAEVAEFYGIVSKLAKHQDWAPANTTTGVRFLNFTSFNDNPAQQFDHAQFRAIIKRAAGRLKSWGDGWRMNDFTFDGDAIENNWKENPNGEGYISRVGKAGRSDLLEWADDQLSPAIDRVNKRYAEQYGWGPANRIERDAAETGATPDNFSARFSPARSDVAGDERSGGRDAADGVAIYGQASPGSVAAQGFHYSGAERKQLDGRYYGTGAKGREAPRVFAAEDKRLRERIYFYVDAGKGITPEQGVGAHGHTVNLNNLYDPDRDTFVQAKIARGLDNEAWLNALESAVIDSGFDGYIRDFGTQRAVVLIGRHSVPVTYTGTGKQTGAVNAETTQKPARRADLPMGKMTGAEWKKLEPRATDLEDGKMYYRDDIKFSPARKLDKESTDESLPQVWYRGQIGASAEKGPFDATALGAPSFADSAEIASEYAMNPEAAGLYGFGSRPSGYSDNGNVAPYRITGKIFDARSLQGGQGTQTGLVPSAVNKILKELGLNDEDVMLDYAGKYGRGSDAFWDSAEYDLPDSRKILAAYTLFDQPEVQEALRNKGYAGAVFNGAMSTTTPSDSSVPWPESKVHGELRAVMPGSLSSSISPYIRYSPPRWYFSPLEKAFESAPDKVFGQAAQVKLWLAGNKSKLGLKDDEIFWTGINDWLDMQGKQKVSKADVLGYFAGSGVQVEEVMKGSLGYNEDNPQLPENYFVADVDEYIAEENPQTNGFSKAVMDESGVVYGVGNNEADAISDAHSGHPELWEKEGETKYGKYVLPGGENYRELLLTLPPKGAPIAQRPSDGLRKPEQIYADPTYRSSHWEEPNILAHIRMNDRVDSTGAKTLFIEEVQSDWGQEGKKKGFVSDGKLPAGWSVEEVKISQYATRWAVFDNSKTQVGTYAETKEGAIKSATTRNGFTGGTPSAPFVTDTKAWLGLSIKRIMAYAAANGYDKVAFINGEQSADRYDLSKQVGFVSLDKTYGGLVVTAYRNDDATDEVLQKTVATENEVADIIGKDATDKLLKDMGTGTHGELRRADLKVGGEGMKTFYDRIVPQVVSDQLKKVGGKMETVGITNEANRYQVEQRRDGVWAVRQDGRAYGPPLNSEDAAQKVADRLNGEMQQPGFTVTPKMSEPLPLFSPRRQTETPEFKAWFGDSKVVDADGKPLVVYHGTMSDFSVFDVESPDKFDSGWLGRGFYFTTSKSTADDYAGFREKGNAESNIMPVYLSISNPLKLRLSMKNTKSQEMALALKVDLKKQLAYDKEDAEFLRDAAIEQGYDGVTFEYTDGSKEIVAFSPTQIKSAIGNNGQFSPTDPDIRRSTRRIVGDSGRPYDQGQRDFFKNVGRDIEQKNLVERTLDFLKKDFAKKMATGIVDQFRGLRDLNDNGKAYTLARLSKGTAGAFDALLHHGKLSLRDGVYDADTSGGFIQRLGVPLNGELDDFLWYVAANRAEKLAPSDREHLFSATDIAKGKTLANGTTTWDYTIQTGPSKGKVTRSRPEIYDDANRIFNEFQKNTLDMAEQSGLIDGASRKYWESEFYVPFYRVSDEDNEFIGNKMGNALVRQQAFKKLKGGTEKLNSDLLSNTLLNFSHLIEASAKNRAAKASLEAAEQVGAAHKAQPGEKKTVWYMDNGQKVEYKVTDPFVMTAITSLEYAGMRNGIMDALSKFKHWLTIGVTASPAFKVRNLIRDSLQAIGTSDLSYNPIKNVTEGFKQTNRDSQEYVSALASGALIRFGTMLEGNESARTRQLIRSGVKDSTILNSEGKWQKFYDKVLEPGITAYNELGNRSEEINRAALYNQLIKQGKSHAEAAMLARDLMDFSMQGSFNTVRFLTQVVPFLNSRLQGLYKLRRAVKDDPRKIAVVTGAVALAGMALMLAYGDDDDWKKREDWDLNNYFWFKFGGVAYRIPRPFEIGAVSSIAERGLQYMIDDEMTGERFRSVMRHLLMDNLAMNPVPQAIKPIIDIYANKDSFTGRPIETMSMSRLDPTERYTSQTSMVARGASAATLGAASPVQIDHLVRAYFGWLGTFVVGGADMAARAMSDQPTKPTMDYFKFITQGIAQEVPSGGSRYLTNIYDQANELEQAHATWRRMLKEGRVDEAAEYREDNKEKLQRYKQVETVKKAEAVFSERIRAIERSNIDPDEKKDRIANINKMKDAAARRLTPGYSG